MPIDDRSAGRSLVRAGTLAIRVSCALVVCRISGSGIRKAALRSVPWIRPSRSNMLLPWFFTGLTKPVEPRTVARAHVIGWRKALEARSLTPALIRRKLSAPSFL